MNNRNRRESLFNLIFTVGLFLIVVIFAIVEIKKFSTIKEENSFRGDDGIWLIDSTGKSTYVDMTTYVDGLFAVNETATNIFGVNYSKEC